MSGTPRTTISVGASHLTLINVFTVAPQRQAELVEALDRATAEIFIHVPGFHSANIHASLDGTRVVNYGRTCSST
jgi:2'-5' RNA ligase